MKQLLATFAALIVGFSAFGQKEGDFIFHKVAPKETLFSLVKRYNTNFATVETLNPELAGGNSDIKIGQLLKFPKNNSVPDVQNHLASTSDRPVQTIHVVKPNETVFSISRLYNVDISNLVEANNITSNTIRVGDRLIVDGATIARIATNTHRETELRLTPTGKSVKETGLAEVIKTPNRTTKYLAMHRSAPVGSAIRITNDATGHTIVAKVIGKLNEKGPDENIMVKLSPYAYYQLRPKDVRLRATVEYYVPDGGEDMASK